MAIVEQISCDVCGVTKGETNHWLVAVIPTDHRGRTAIAFAPLGQEQDEEMLDEGDQLKHLCGEKCAHTQLSQWLELNNNTPTERQANDNRN